MTLTWILMVTLLCLAVVLSSSARVVKQFERGVLFRFGRVDQQTRGPGLTFILPGRDRLQKVNMQIITMPVQAQDGITRDNVTVRVDAVVHFRVIDALRVAVDVQDYGSAIGQVAQTSLRSIIGKSMLDDLLSDRERLNQGLEDRQPRRWLGRPHRPGRDQRCRLARVDEAVHVPPGGSRTRATRPRHHRRWRAPSLREAGRGRQCDAETPAALQLRLLETIVEVAAEKNSTLVLPFPVELLRFLERAPIAAAVETASSPASPTAPLSPAASAVPILSTARIDNLEGRSSSNRDDARETARVRA